MSFSKVRPLLEPTIVVKDMRRCVGLFPPSKIGNRVSVEQKGEHQQNWPTRPEYQQQEQKDEGTKNPDCSPLRPLGPKRGHLEFSYLVIVLRAVYIQLLCLPDFCLIQSLHSIFQSRRQIDYWSCNHRVTDERFIKRLNGQRTLINSSCIVILVLIDQFLS